MKLRVKNIFFALIGSLILILSCDNNSPQKTKEELSRLYQQGDVREVILAIQDSRRIRKHILNDTTLFYIYKDCVRHYMQNNNFHRFFFLADDRSKFFQQNFISWLKDVRFRGPQYDNYLNKPLRNMSFSSYREDTYRILLKNRPYNFNLLEAKYSTLDPVVDSLSANFDAWLVNSLKSEKTVKAILNRYNKTSQELHALFVGPLRDYRHLIDYPLYRVFKANSALRDFCVSEYNKVISENIQKNSKRVLNFYYNYYKEKLEIPYDHNSSRYYTPEIGAFVDSLKLDMNEFFQIESSNSDHNKFYLSTNNNGGRNVRNMLEESSQFSENLSERPLFIYPVKKWIEYRTCYGYSQGASYVQSRSSLQIFILDPFKQKVINKSQKIYSAIPGPCPSRFKSSNPGGGTSIDEKAERSLVLSVID